MEPRIQYAKTADGVSIAFWTLGEGMPLIHTPPSLSTGGHLELEWRVPLVRSWYEALAGARMLVRYDGRGTGLSDREDVRHSLDGWIMDLESVAERAGRETFDLLALYSWAMPAIAYAARHPDRISHLIVWCGYTRWSDLGPGYQALPDLMDKDWELYIQTAARSGWGWATTGAEDVARLLRESADPESLKLALAAIRQTDVTGLLPHIRAPTLVIHRRGLASLDLSVARRLASQIPNARLQTLEGASLFPAEGEVPGLLAAIDDFLGEGEPSAGDAEPPAPGAFRTVLFTDVEGSTALTQRLGDAGARAVLREHERIVRDALKSHGGAEVKTMGDGFMASFASAAKALECAVALQRAFAERNASVPAHPEEPRSVAEGRLEGPVLSEVEGRAEPQPPAHASRASARAGGGAGATTEPIRVRIGLNAGEPIAEEEDLFGTAVIVAARIAAQAAGGEILTSNVVRELVAGKGFLFADRGEVALRGFEEPVRLYEVRWQE